MSKHKIAVVGSGAVGKSCLTIQFLYRRFVSEYDPTIEDAYRKQVVIDDDEEAVMLDILDTAGQEDFSALRGEYAQSGDAFLLVYSMTSEGSFDEIGKIRQEILDAKDADSVPMVLAANKCDLESERQVSTAVGQARAKEWGMPYVETSAKTFKNVDEAFFSVVREIRRFNGTLPVEPKKKSWCALL